jgi:hypothetical protein
LLTFIGDSHTGLVSRTSDREAGAKIRDPAPHGKPKRKAAGIG